MFEQRLNAMGASPEGFRAMLAVETHVRAHVDAAIQHLIKVRASQINGCAYCIDMHWKDARAAGMPEDRLYALSAWRESPLYSEKERAALAWTEALTLVAVAHNSGGVAASDEDYEGVRGEFNDQELVDLTLAITTINAWNRLAIGFRSTPGVYQARGKH
jgi:AhpD family alkylhydroperoxidase